MSRQITATEAKNQFGVLLEEVLAGGRVEITKHGRVVAVLQAARTVVSYDWQPEGYSPAWVAREPEREETQAREAHFIPPRLARAAKLVKRGR